MSVDTFKYPLKKIGLHIDFLRLKCGGEEIFHQGIRQLKESENEKPAVFIAFAEWDAVVILPSNRLYPPGLNQLYGLPAIATSIAGNAGYFSYLWDHPINDGVPEKLARFEASGIGTLISLRFEDWLRNKLGLAAELVVCDALQERLKRGENDGISAVVANTLGWNDVAILLHASKNEHRLTDLLSQLRILTLGDVIAKNAIGFATDEFSLPIFAASYTHLIGSYDQYAAGKLSVGGLCSEIIAAKLLVRVPASFEPEIRESIAPELPDDPPCGTPLQKMPSEMGHYSFSANVTALAKTNGAERVLSLIRKTRAEIGRLGGGTYAETSTIFTFEERQEGIEKLNKTAVVEDLQDEIAAIALVLKDLPGDLVIRGASPMTIHRFATVMITLIDHLSDPVRSSAVRHAATFIRTLPDRIGGLSREAIDDLCHVCEAAIGQAIDGIAQFQHDANSIGLSGRGGYNRLIGAVEMFTRDLFVALHIKQEPPLITFGLRTGTPGSLDRFQIDIPFRVVFTPSDWYILVHEIGHLFWVESFGWMSESIATFEALSREILLNRATDSDPNWEKMDKAARAEFLSARSVVRELFPNLLVFRLACGDDLARFDRLSMHHVLRESGTNDGTRSMLIAVVLHALLDAMTAANEPLAPPAPEGLDRARAWWQGWGEWRNRLKGMVDRGRFELGDLAQAAIDSVSEVLATLGTRTDNTIGVNDKQKILGSRAFRDTVVDTLTSVIDVLALAGQQFSIKDSPGASLFQGVQEAIDDAVGDQIKHEEWSETFAAWLAAGEVFALIPPGHVWLWLLLEADEKLRPRSSPEFMVSQLSIVLSMWHRAVTARPTGKSEDVMNKLESIRLLKYAESLPRLT